MKIVKSVIEHCCRLIRSSPLRKNQLLAGKKYRYVLIDGDEKNPLYQLLPKCRCRKFVTRAEANELVTGSSMNKTAMIVWRVKRRVVEPDLDAIWLTQQPRVPRVDLITKAHMERAYVDGQFIDITYIEEVHKMHMAEREKWMIPYIEDPCMDPDSTDFDRAVSSRIINPFAVDQRT
jgi:hypothetical protein